MTATPTPMATAIAPEPSAPPAAAAPSHLFGLQPADIRLIGHRRLRHGIGLSVIERRDMQQGHSLSPRCGLNGKPGTGSKADGEFQKMTALHRDPP
ncbi:MAG: hypothetical protein H7312_12930 [Tardiphaga sp.]|nr:hypothetical protein [Tardiphaga sp.]